MPFIDQKELFEKTDGGRLVIEQYYPQSMESFANPHRKFKCRTSEKTASSSLKRMPDGVWVVTDFGEDEKPRNAIQIVMFEEKLDFGKAINLIAAQFNIVPEAKRAEIYKPEIRKRKAEKEEVDGTTTFKPKPFTVKEVKTILAPKVWEYLIYRVSSKLAADVQEAEVLKEVTKVFEKYHFYSLESYTTIRDREATTISSTELFPIFMFDEKDWQKIYKPREVNAGYRFQYAGDKPKEHLFGFDIARKAYDEVIKIDQEDSSLDDEVLEAVGIEGKGKRKDKKPKKLENVLIVSGGSDGLNLAVIGQCFKGKEIEDISANFYPVWMNSETAKLQKGQWDNLKAISASVYNIPDIDATGKKQAHALALEYLEMKTLYLPEELKAKTDSFRRKPMKDLRDYFRYYKVWDFFTLIKTAYPYRFWDSMPPTDKKPKWTYNVNNKHLYNFLARNGFYRYETEAEKDGYIYIRIEGNIVRKLEPKRVRDFINEFIEKRNPDVELMNTFLRTNQLNEASLSNLPYIKIDFTDYDKETQWTFFNNITCEITSAEVKEYKPGEVNKYVWEDEVINHKAKVLPDFFTISPCSSLETKEPGFDIQIHNQDCLVFRYLMNTSRLSWREELETRLEGIKTEKDREEYSAIHKFTKEDEKLMDGLPTEAEREEYAKTHRWNINGPLLTEREQYEQRAHLINKIFALGYQWHRHRESGKPWCIWGMDAKLSDGNESHGGTGKSLLPNLLHSQKLIKAQYREGRNPKLTDNPHFWEGTDRHTDMMLIDDCNRYMKFDFFFSAIGGPITVNPKNNKQYTIGGHETPKIWFTSNFPPYDADPSTDRRIIYMLYSDYYHYSRMGEYREDRSVLDEFGKNFGNEFSETEWNLFLNFIMQCCKFYLSCTAKVNPPMDNVNKRNLKNLMGDTFAPWADAYFSTESDKLDKLLVKEDVYKDFVSDTKAMKFTIHKFKKCVEAWCYYNSYELNPKTMLNAQKRLIQRVMVSDGSGGEKEMTKEMIYIKTKPALDAVVERHDKRVAAKKEEEEEIPF